MSTTVGSLLGLDVGNRRIGIAISNAGSFVCTPLKTIERGGGKAEREVIALINQHQIVKLIVGLPFSENGEKNEQCLKVEAFCRRLQKRIAIEICFVDEYASSYEAEEKLRQAGNPGKGLKKGGLLDAAAAAIILQSYLDGERARAPT